MTDSVIPKRKYIKKKHHQTRQGEWSQEEHDLLLSIIRKIGLGRWAQTARMHGSRSPGQCQIHYYKYKISHGLTDQQFLQQIGCPLNLIEKRMSKKLIKRQKRIEESDAPPIEDQYLGNVPSSDFSPDLQIYNIID